MHDALTMEKAGKPVALVCTEPFVNTARMIAKIKGIADYPFSVIPHPIVSLEDDQLMERARLALPKVLQLLVSSKPPSDK